MNRQKYLDKMQQTRSRVMRMLAAGKSQKEIAEALGKRPSSICRMVKKERAK